MNDETESNDTVAIKIPKEIYDKISDRIKDTDFSSVDEYIKYVLQEVLSDDESEDEEVLSEEDEEKVKERLRSLGYLD